jgi:hypothetical protein
VRFASCELARRTAVSIVAMILDRSAQEPDRAADGAGAQQRDREGGGVRAQEPDRATNRAGAQQSDREGGGVRTQADGARTQPSAIVREVPGPRTPIIAQALVSTAAREAGAELTGLLRADLGWVAGVLPNPTLAIAFAGGLASGSWRGEVALTFFLAQETTLPDRADVGGKVALLSGALRGCRSAWFPDLSLCTGAELGILSASPFGAIDEKKATLPWAAFSLGPTISYPIAPGAALRFRLEGVLPFGSRVALLAVERGELVERPLFTPWPIALRLGLGGEIFW